ncbi:MAG: TldD/PmbA family protein [Planctomycetes bacterium]|nr:TldD/PmbA family protein [Planctomycetota bacterium]
MTGAGVVKDIGAAALLERLRDRTDEAEVFGASSDALEVRFTAGQVKTALARESSGLAVRAKKGGRLGFAGSRDTSVEGLDRLVLHTEHSIDVGDATEVRFPGQAPAPVDDEALGGHDEATAALGVADLVAYGRQVVDPLRARFPGVVFDVVIRRAAGRTELVNSAGARVAHRRTVFSVGVEANRTQDQDVLMDYTSVAAPARAAVDPAEVVAPLLQRLAWAERTVAFQPGRLPVLFTPPGSLVLWGPLLEALSGKTVMLGTSPLREKVGQRVLDPRVHLTDDGLLPGALGSAPFDDEGVPRRRTPLVEAGVLRGFVHDLETAQATGQAPTGNGERGGVMGRPGPGFSNIVAREGEAPWADLLKGVRRGLLVQSVIGMGQGNTLPGTFSNPIDVAYAIEDGQVTGRVKDVSIAGNVYDLLGPAHLGGLSREVESVYGAYRLPWLLVNDVNVVGKGGA